MDVHVNVQGGLSGETMTNVFAGINAGQFTELPVPFRPGDNLPEGTRMQLVMNQSSDATYDLIKVYTFEQPRCNNELQKIATGRAMTPVFREGPWSVKKAFQRLMHRLPGHHMHCAEVELKGASSNSDSKGWNPSKEEIDEGLALINRRADEGGCPESNEDSEQLAWILNQQKNGALKGWPFNIIQKAADQKSKRNACADAISYFPLLTSDLKPFFTECFLPLIWPLLLNSSLLVIGVSGVGKTPGTITIMMAMCRMWACKKQTKKPAAYRRSKEINGFKDKPGSINEGNLLDDPKLSSVPIADLRSFFEILKV